MSGERTLDFLGVTPGQWIAFLIQLSIFVWYMGGQNERINTAIAAEQQHVEEVSHLVDGNSLQNTRLSVLENKIEMTQRLFDNISLKVDKIYEITAGNKK